LGRWRAIPPWDDKRTKSSSARTGSQLIMPNQSDDSRINIRILGLGGMAQVVEYLPSKCEALHSNPTTTKFKKKKRISYRTIELNARRSR
jgi:hypothetical protein